MNRKAMYALEDYIARHFKGTMPTAFRNGKYTTIS